MVRTYSARVSRIAFTSDISSFTSLSTSRHMRGRSARSSSIRACRRSGRSRPSPLRCRLPAQNMPSLRARLHVPLDSLRASASSAVVTTYGITIVCRGGRSSRSRFIQYVNSRSVVAKMKCSGRASASSSTGRSALSRACRHDGIGSTKTGGLDTFCATRSRFSRRASAAAARDARPSCVPPSQLPQYRDVDGVKPVKCTSASRGCATRSGCSRSRRSRSRSARYCAISGETLSRLSALRVRITSRWNAACKLEKLRPGPSSR